MTDEAKRLQTWAKKNGTSPRIKATLTVLKRLDEQCADCIVQGHDYMACAGVRTVFNEEASNQGSLRLRQAVCDKYQDVLDEDRLLRRVTASWIPQENYKAWLDGTEENIYTGAAVCVKNGIRIKARGVSLDFGKTSRTGSQPSDMEALWACIFAAAVHGVRARFVYPPVVVSEFLATAHLLPALLVDDTDWLVVSRADLISVNTQAGQILLEAIKTRIAKGLPITVTYDDDYVPKTKEVQVLFECFDDWEMVSLW